MCSIARRPPRGGMAPEGSGHLGDNAVAVNTTKCPEPTVPRGAGMRAVAEVFEVTHKTIGNWIKTVHKIMKNKQKKLLKTASGKPLTDIIELDEIYTYCKKNGTGSSFKPSRSMRLFETVRPVAGVMPVSFGHPPCIAPPECTPKNPTKST